MSTASTGTSARVPAGGPPASSPPPSRASSPRPSRDFLSAQVAAEVRAHLTDRVYETVIPRSVRLSEAPSHGLPIALYDPASRGADAYRELAGEVAARG